MFIWQFFSVSATLEKWRSKLLAVHPAKHEYYHSLRSNAEIAMIHQGLKPDSSDCYQYQE
jgi:hypothetical protein